MDGHKPRLAMDAFDLKKGGNDIRMIRHFYKTEQSVHKQSKQNDCNGTIQIYIPHNHDVLLGRKAIAHKHAGNQILRNIIAQKMEAYRNAFYREQKKMIAEGIVKQIKTLVPAGRFLKNNCSEWHEVDHEKCIAKVCQTLRDQAKHEDDRDTSGISAAYQTRITCSNSRNKSIADLKQEVQIGYNINVLTESNCKEATELTIDFDKSSIVQEPKSSSSSDFIDDSSKRTVRQNSLKNRILHRRRYSENSACAQEQHLEKSMSVPTNISVDASGKKRSNQWLELEIKKTQIEDVERNYHKQVMIHISFLGKAFLANPVFSVQSRRLLENVANLGTNANDVTHLPSVIESLCTHIEKLEKNNLN